MSSSARTALITGITGQDGGYLAELLTGKGYRVSGLVRSGSPTPPLAGVDLVEGDLTDRDSLARALDRIAPDEVYNLASQSQVGVSFEKPEWTADVNGMGALRLLELLYGEGGSDTRFFQAGTAEVFAPSASPVCETAPFGPRNPYAAAKLFAQRMVAIYRDHHDAHASTGILFNHESPRRSPRFVTRKITLGVAALRKGAAEPLTLGNLDAERDWGDARDFAEAMWLMLQAATPDDYVIATGTAHRVRDFVATAFAAVDIRIVWEGTGTDETGRCARTGRLLVTVDPRFYRRHDEAAVAGDASKARAQLGWVPKRGFEELVREMVETDLKALESV